MPHVKLSKEFASGVTDTSIAAGPNGYVLTVDTAAVSGFNWTAPGGGGGGSVTSVTGGTNVTITGTPTVAPVVNLSSPLTSTLNVGAQTISSSTGTIEITPLAGSDCNVNCSGTGHLHVDSAGAGGAAQPLLVLENTNGNANGVHIDLYKNSASPAANDTIGGLSFHGKSSTGVIREYASLQSVIDDPTNTSENASISLNCCNNASAPTAFLTCNGNVGYVQTNKPIDTLGNQITTTTGAVNLYQSLPNQNIGLTNVASGGSIIINKSTGFGGSVQINSATSASLTASSSVVISSSGAGLSFVATPGTGMITNQIASQRTILRTGLTTTSSLQPVDYIPMVHVDNGNTNSVGVQGPLVSYQTLIIINNGVTPASSWSDIGNANGYVDTMFLASSGYVWLAMGSSIYVFDTTFTTIFQTFTLGGTSSGGSTRALCFWEETPYIFIGGDFTSINGNATNQYGLTRVFVNTSVGSYFEDPIYDSTNSIYGINGYVNTITSKSGILYCGGNFTTFTNSSTAQYGFRVQNYGASGGSQTYDNDSGALNFNGEVFCSCSTGSLVFFGGGFTTVQNGAYGYSYFANYDGANFSYCDGNNFNGPVYSCAPSSLGSYILAAGSFSQGGFSNTCYVDSVSPTSAATYAAGSATVNRNGVYCVGGTDIIQTTDTSVYRSTSFGSFNYEGQSNGGFTPTGIIIYGGTPFASYNNYNVIRNLLAVSQAASFGFPSPIIRYAGATYQTATLNSKYQSQQFVADITGTYYYPVGNPLASFS